MLWLPEILKLHMWIIFGAQIIFHLDSAGLDHKLLEYRASLVSICMIFLVPNVTNQYALNALLVNDRDLSGYLLP